MRASRLPLSLLCPASQLEPAVKIGGDPSAADLGTAAHWMLTGLVSGKRQFEDMHEAALVHRVPLEELQMLVGIGWRCWRQVAEHFPAPAVEVAMSNEGSGESPVLTGHCDVLSVSDGIVRVADYKTGRINAKHDAQLRAYALLAMRTV